MFAKDAVEMGGDQAQGGGKFLHGRNRVNLGFQERFCAADQLVHLAAGPLTSRGP